MRALLLAFASLLLASPGRGLDSAELLADAQRAYDADRFAEAAASFTSVLASSDDAEQIDRSAYMLATLLLFNEDADAITIVRELEGLDPGLERVVRETRDGYLDSAARALAFLRFRSAELPRATRNILATLEARLGPVQVDVALAWEREVPHATDVDVGLEGTVWLLIAEPPSFARIDRMGEIVERVPFVPPDALDAQSLATAHFAVRPDGGFQLGGHRYGPDGVARGTTRVYPPEDAAAASDGTTVFLHGDGLRAVGPDGNVRWQRLGRGRRQGSFHHPQALALDGNAIFVGESRRLQRFSLTGDFELALDAVSSGRLPSGFRLRDLSDVTISRRRVFAGHVNSESVDVYSSHFEPLTSFRMPSRRISATPDGMIFGLKDERLTAAFEVPEASRRLAPANVPRSDVPAPKSWRSETTPVHFVPLQSPPPSVRVHVSTRHMTSLSAAPSQPGGVYLGTYGGLLRWQLDSSGDGAWQHWTRMDGFPSDVVHDVHEGPDGALWVVVSGAVLLRRAGETGWHRMERDGFAVNGQAVIGDALHPGFVWIAAQRGLFRLGARSVKADFVPMERGPEEVVQLPDGRLFVRLGVDGVASVNPETGSTRVLVEMEDLRRAQGLREPTRDRWIMTLSADPAVGVLWLGTDRRELFALDLESGRLREAWIDGAIRPGCAKGEIRAQRVADTLHVLGFGCHALLRGRSKQLSLVFEHEGRGLDLLATQSSLLLATTDGLYRLRDGGGTTRIERPGSEPPDWAPVSMAEVDGQIWVGFGNHGVGIYDGERWREIEAASSVDRIRVDEQGVLAIASYGYGRAYRIGRNGTGLEWVAPGGSSWTYLRDLHFDGADWWAVGGPDPRRKHGIRRWRQGREKYWGRASGMPFGEARRILADPDEPGLLWIASDVGLVRFEKQSGTAEIVWPGDVKWLECLDDGALWAYGSGLLHYDTKTGLGSPFPFSGIPARDPRDPNVLWLVHDKKLLRVDATSGSALSEHAIGLGSLHPRGLEVLPDGEGWSAWIAATGGVVEVRIPPSSLVPAARELEVELGD